MTVRAEVDGRWGLIVVVACFVAQALSCGMCYSFGVMFAELLKEFDQTESATAWIGSIQSAVTNFSGLFVGPLVYKFGGRNVGVVGALIIAVSYVTSSSARNIYILYLTYGIVGGLGMGLMYIPACIVIHHYVDRWRSVASSVACAGTSVGTMIMAPVSQWLVDELGWRKTMTAQGCIALIGVLCAVTYLPVTDVNSERQRLVHRKAPEILETLESQLRVDSTPHVIDNEEAVGENLIVSDDVPSSRNGVSTNDIKEHNDESARQATITLIKCRPFLTYLVGAVFYSFGFNVPATYLPIRSETVCDVDNDQSALLLTALSAGSTVGRLATGFGFICCHSNVIGTAQCIHLSTLKLGTLATAAVLTGLMSTLLFAMNDYETTMFYAIAVGFCQGCLVAISSLVLVDMVGITNVAHVVSLTWFAFSIGLMFGSPLTGWLVEIMNGDYNVPFAIIGTVQIVGGLLFCSTRFFVWPTESAMSSE